MTTDTTKLRLARVETAAEVTIGYVEFPITKEPKLIRDQDGRVYEAKLDDFCTFACYREVPVAKVKLMTATGPDVPAWSEVWRQTSTQQKFVVQSDEKIREILSSQDYEFVTKRPHGEPNPDFSYLCWHSHCRCQSCALEVTP